MKLIIQSNRIVATATDAYSGPDQFLTAPDDFDINQMSDYVITGDTVTLDIETIISRKTQLRLDTFAKQRGYDSIHTGCGAINSKVPKFQAQGQSCQDAFDNTWSTIDTIKQAVLSGARPIPKSFEEIEPELPVLTWSVD